MRGRAGGVPLVCFMRPSNQRGGAVSQMNRPFQVVFFMALSSVTHVYEFMRFLGFLCLNM